MYFLLRSRWKSRKINWSRPKWLLHALFCVCVLNIGYISRFPPSSRIAHNVPFFLFSYVLQNNEEKISKWFFLPFIQSGICSKKAAVDCYDSYSSIPGRSSSISHPMKFIWKIQDKSNSNRLRRSRANNNNFDDFDCASRAQQIFNANECWPANQHQRQRPDKKKNTIRTKHILFNENTIRNIERTFCVSHGCFSSRAGCLVFVKPLQAILIHWRFSWIFLGFRLSVHRPTSVAASWSIPRHRRQIVINILSRWLWLLFLANAFEFFFLFTRFTLHTERRQRQ